ncbi:hypothetical protein QBC34DRAFT_83152 [Podospora aff. communis PSN243]|uniref:Uncharacterized protein n=1 Tax=Podospora aff. communis PSN243 TaxID=3040156 RepID=A0AAV9GP86_9PEZI|nr:hypothetical protein QBC34DRAFT_83152 [Podospora aff. communis PSN243]
MPLPAIPTRARRGTRTNSFMRPVVAVESKPSELVQAVEPLSNLDVKAPEDDQRQLDKAAPGPPGVAIQPLTSQPIPPTVDLHGGQSDRSVAKIDHEPPAIADRRLDLAVNGGTESSDEEVEPSGEDLEIPAQLEERYHSDDEAYHIVSSPDHLPRNFPSARSVNPDAQEVRNTPVPDEHPKFENQDLGAASLHEHYGVHDFDVKPLNISKAPTPEPIEQEISQKDDSLAREVDRAVSHLSEAASLIGVHEFEKANRVGEPAVHEIDDDGGSLADDAFDRDAPVYGDIVAADTGHVSGPESDSEDEEDARPAKADDVGSADGDRAQPWPLPEQRGDSALERHERRESATTELQDGHVAIDKVNVFSDDADPEHIHSPQPSHDEGLAHEVGLGVTHDEVIQHGPQHWDASHESEAESNDDFERHAHAPDSIQVPMAAEQDLEHATEDDLTPHEAPSVEKDAPSQAVPMKEDETRTHPEDDLSEPETPTPPCQDQQELPHERGDGKAHERHLSTGQEAAHDTPAMQTLLGPAGSVADSDSPAFFTPLASAGIRSPAAPEQRTLADELDYADDDSDFTEEDVQQRQIEASGNALPDDERTAALHDDPYIDSRPGQYQAGDPEDHTTTVHGQDTLFDYDDHSVGSSVARGESPTFEQHAINGGIPDDSFAAEASEVAKTVATASKDDEKELDVPHTAVEHSMPTDTAVHHEASRHEWADEADSYFDQSSNLSGSLATPPLRSSQTPPTETSQLDLNKEMPPSTNTSPSANRGLAASRHNPERPQTPVQESDEVRHDYETEDVMPRDVTNMSWHVRNSSTPRSLHSQSTISSAPTSPVQHHSLDNHDPAIRHSWQTSSNSYYSGRPRGDSSLTDNSGLGRFDSISKEPPPPMPQWEAQEPFAPSAPLEDSYRELRVENNLEIETDPIEQRTPTSAGTSLFQRMRNVFEQASPTTSQRPASFSKPTSLSQRSSRYGADNEDDDSDENSSLLYHGAGTRTSAN